MQETKAQNVMSPVHFAEAMSKYWINKLGNATSPKLEAVWRSMASEFGLAIFHSYGIAPKSYSTTTTGSGAKPWHILQPPTGSGKTQGTALYCSMVAKRNVDDANPVGVLVVVRLIEQCEEMTKAVNELAGSQVAYAHHTEKPLTYEEMHNADILVITQAALVRAFEGLVKEKRNRWADFSEWKYGKRGLLIIDEALAGVIEENKLTLDNLRFVLGLIPHELREKHKDAIDALTKLQTLLERLASSATNEHKVVWVSDAATELDAPLDVDLYALRQAVRLLPLDRLLIGKESSRDRGHLRNIIDKTFKDAQAILERWTVYSRNGREHTLNSALLLIPDDAPAAVVLDATASQSELWEILGDRANVRPVPQDARNYSNVTLHVCRWNGVGKGKMIELADTRFPRLIHDLEGRLGPESKVFICAHKAVKHVALGLKPNFASYDVGHWGAIDGRNDWQDYDTAVIFGLPYRDLIWANNMFFSVHGPKDDEWLKEPKWKEHEDVRQMMQQRQMSVSVIQAINRVRCRRVINDKGECRPTDVYIVLPKGSTGDAILSAIQQEMPNIKVADWEFELDGQKVKVRRGSSHEGVIAYMAQRLPGETPMSEIQAALKLTPAAAKELRKVLKDDSHPLTKELVKNVIRYETRGQGRGSKSYLVKAA